ncbi:MAG: hypothetical protein IPK78_15985 [Rhodospirillales bacterium]|nr:hypothetical protein [Rhodospirillales bacterium]
MWDLIQSGQIVGVILAILLVEVVLLLLYRRFRGCGPTYGALFANALSGACLLLALRAALAGAAPPSIAAWLVGALVAHIADLRFRWRSN